MGIEVTGDESGNGRGEREEEKQIKGVCGGWDVMVEINNAEMKGGRLYVDTDQVIGGEGSEKGKITGRGKAFPIEEHYLRSRVADSQEAGGQREEAFPSQVAGSPCSRHSCQIRVRDLGCNVPPRWFLN
jgi:hypothetical protein